MIVKTDCFNQIRLIFISILNILFYDFLETVYVELLVEGWLELSRFSELFISFLFILHLFELEECIAESELGAIWKLFQSSFEHLIYLLLKLTTHGIHAIRIFLLLFLGNFQRAICLITELFVFFDVAYEQSSTDVIFLLIAYEFKDSGKVGFEFLSCFEFEVI